MITIFSPMRPFRADIAEVQLNAIRSWLAIRPRCEIILVDDEEGTTAAATRGLDVRVVTEVKRSGLGAPLLDDLLRVGTAHATGEILAYNTADVILPSDFVTKILGCHQLMHGASYLAIGSRVDLTRHVHMKFDGANWFDEVTAAVKAYGRPHGYTAADLWVYPKTLWLDPPPFPIGRHLTDGWAIHHARRERIPVIDLTKEVLIVHQLHDRPAKRSPLFYQEQLECVRLFDRAAENALNLLDADWIYQSGKLVRPPGLRRLHASMALFRPYRWLVGLRRKHKLPHLYRVPLPPIPPASA
jgi:hypothetical protein